MRKYSADRYCRLLEKMLAKRKKPEKLTFLVFLRNAVAYIIMAAIAFLILILVHPGR